MTEKEPPTIQLTGADPRLPFYITADLYLDDSVDVASEGKDALSLDAAIEHACHIAEEHGGESYVVECRVIRKVTPRKPHVQIFKTKNARP